MPSQNNLPRAEYPRPDLVRPEWMNLNGPWRFAYDDEDRGLAESWFNDLPQSREITVPFCYQSAASGIGLPDEKHEILWYSRQFSLPEAFAGSRVLLHFGAVDYEAKVWVDGSCVGGHTGGSTPFSFDITDALQGDGAHNVTLRVFDSCDCTQPRGKQSWKDKPFACWYAPVSGIWQTVWLEPVAPVHIRRLRLTPDIDRRTLSVELYPSRPVDGRLDIRLRYGEQAYPAQPDLSLRLHKDRTVIKATLDLREICQVDNIHYWTPEHPNLYDLRLELHQDNGPVDAVETYFGMRKIDIRDGVIRLNNAPYYQKLVLDQGYWPDTLLTPPSGEAIVRDIELTKAMGFNGARKHQKIEDPMYYYWADKLGLLVWGEVPSAYEFCTGEMENLISCTREFVQRDYNHPCIVLWVPLNESWGVRNIGEDPAQQRFGRAMYHLLNALDGTRPISTNDGWEQVESDICGIHDYTAWTKELNPGYSDISTLQCPNGERMLYAAGTQYAGQPVLITEYGGIAFAKDSKGGNWGYNGAVGTVEEFLARYADITAGFSALPYVQGYCYTQLTDTFQEMNGLLDMERRPKVPLEALRRINSFKR